jgi:hypothetical protein
VAGGSAAVDLSALSRPSDQALPKAYVQSRRRCRRAGASPSQPQQTWEPWRESSACPRSLCASWPWNHRPHAPDRRGSGFVGVTLAAGTSAWPRASDTSPDRALTEHRSCLAGPYRIAGGRRGREWRRGRSLRIVAAIRPGTPKGIRSLSSKATAGWRVPITATVNIEPWLRELGPLALIVERAGLRTINHTPLTIEAVLRDGVARAAIMLSHQPDDSPKARQLPDVKSILALTTTTSRHRSPFVDRGS